LNGLNVTVSGGMAQGLPLANPQQAGVLLKGQIYQAFGNWIGTDQTLDMFFVAGGVATGSPTIPTNKPGASNFSFIWPAGSSLASAIGQTLSTAMPGLTQSFAISPNLVTNAPQTGHYSSFQAFADAMKTMTRGILGGTYLGVQMTNDGTTISVYDGTTMGSGGSTMISFQDLIGQPTWIAPGTISVKTVLRADIHQGATINLPPSLVTNSAAALTRFQDQTAFSGAFMVQQIHHYGHSRQPSASDWATVFQVNPLLT
jgi:hypothetical protein